MKEKYLKDAQNEYIKRLSRYTKIEIIEVDDEKAPEKLSKQQELIVIQKEGEKILKRVPSDSYVIVLDLKGEMVSSTNFSDKINSLMLEGKSNITFIIGGSLGVGKEILKKADYSLCLSMMIYPHQIAKIILLEQVYRGYKIINGETYHKWRKQLTLQI